MARDPESKQPREGLGRLLLNLGLASALGGGFGVGTTILGTNSADDLQDCKLAQEIVIKAADQVPVVVSGKYVVKLLAPGSPLVKQAERKVAECLGD